MESPYTRFPITPVSVLLQIIGQMFAVNSSGAFL